MFLKVISVVSDLLFGNVEKKYEAKHKVLDVISYKLGYRLYNKNLIWHKDSKYLDLWGPFAKKAGYKSSFIHERRYNFLSLCESVANLEGSTAECGSYKGAGSYLILKASEGLGKRHYIFDSFEGLSEPDQEDSVADVKTFKWDKHDMTYPEAKIRENLSDFDNVEFYKGWIPSRFNEVENLKFSFVHIDVDLYQPTLDSLAFFYERMVSGGIIVCDDYGSSACPGAKKAFDDFLHSKPESAVSLTAGHAFIVKR